MSAWTWDWLFKKECDEDELLSLKWYILNDKLKLRLCLLIAKGLMRRICTLHQFKLVQLNLDVDDVSFKRHRPVSNIIKYPNCIDLYIDRSTIKKVLRSTALTAG